MSHTRPSDPISGPAEAPPDNRSLAETLLEALRAIHGECQRMKEETLHYSLTKHVHAIQESVCQMTSKLTGRQCPFA